MGTVDYDEFGLFHENAAEWGLPFEATPDVRRVSVDLADGRQISSLLWREGPPRLVLVHGGAQNAHTYDTVALALDDPLLCVDLPGHGHSDGGRDGVLDQAEMADDVARVIEELCGTPVVLVGMSLGGLVSLQLAAKRPDLVDRLVLVDITPGVNGDKASHITNFINGPTGFESFDELLERTMAFNPTRSASSLRRGILHNAVELEDGTWVWRWARHGSPARRDAPDRQDLWNVLGQLTMPVMLARGMDVGSVVDDEDEAELLRRLPEARVEHVEGAGHSIQGDQPLVLAALIAEFSRTS